jgi:transposase
MGVIAVDEVGDEPLYLERVAALDVGKAQVEVCIRVPGDRDRRRRAQEIRSFGTTKSQILALADWLRSWQVGHVAMESTSDYWKAPFFRLEAEGFQCELLDAKQVKALPGRPKTDRADAAWLARNYERGMVAPCFVATEQFRRLRTLTRYRRNLTGERTREKQRVEKLLEDAMVKMSVVVSDIFGVSGREMMAALIAGQRNPRMLASLARGTMRNKIAQLEAAFDGADTSFTDHHAFVLSMMLANIDHLTNQIEALTAQIEELISPFEAQLTQLDAIPGIGAINAQDILAEIGVDMSRFPSPAHLVSWAGFCPQVKESAGRQRGRSARKKGNRYLAAALGEAAIVAGRGKTRLGARYRRVARRRGKAKAQVAVGNTLLGIIHTLLSQPETTYDELGADYYDTKINRRRQITSHIASLQRLGYRVTLEQINPAA